jgi:F0F1-type ATP synthase alpha subunit
MVLDKVSGEINYDSKKYNELEKAIEIQKQMDSFQNENDQKLLELLQQSETSDKEINSKVTLVQYNTEIDAAVERVSGGEFVTNDEVFEEIENEEGNEY